MHIDWFLNSHKELKNTRRKLGRTIKPPRLAKEIKALDKSMIELVISKLPTTMTAHDLNQAWLKWSTLRDGDFKKVFRNYTRDLLANFITIPELRVLIETTTSDDLRSLAKKQLKKLNGAAKQTLPPS